jgi:protein TonB
LQTYIARNIDYPEAAIDEDIQGKVFVRFIVNDKGMIENESIIRSIHPLLDKEALRVVKSFPKWKPGMQNGKAVKVWYTVPIVFRIKKLDFSYYKCVL